MKISFVIPAYNEEALIGQCISSIQKEIDAAKADAEIIVVNNASTDRTKEVASEYPGVIVVDEARKGLTRARQAGFLASTGELIANIDADAMLVPGWIYEAEEEFEKDPKLVGLSGPYIYYDLPFFSRALWYSMYVLGYPVYVFNQFVLGTGSIAQGGNFVIRATTLKEIGGHNTDIEFYGEDVDLIRRLAPLGKLRWKFTLRVYCSGRRLKAEGIVTMIIRYGFNYLSTIIYGKPMTEEYKDIRG